MHPLVNDVMVVAWHLTMGKEQLKIFAVVTATIAKQSFIKIIIIVSKGLKNDMHLESYWNNSSTNFTSNHKLLTKHCQNLQYLIIKKKNITTNDNNSFLISYYFIRSPKL